jgi:hypothetical protein
MLLGHFRCTASGLVFNQWMFYSHPHAFPLPPAVTKPVNRKRRLGKESVQSPSGFHLFLFPSGLWHRFGYPCHASRDSVTSHFSRLHWVASISQVALHVGERNLPGLSHPLCSPLRPFPVFPLAGEAVDDSEHFPSLYVASLVENSVGHITGWKSILKKKKKFIKHFSK